ncbi:hypothetical protein [uncultured Chloroflexus sp.]|uniref:hypothetical protein n=1 Tax=uncultured Chloroflexus sp. TaxID=214040 RepID=UPI00262AFF5D|nr:hypothetical protein [uncultured Chloroflexus sp.]
MRGFGNTPEGAHLVTIIPLHGEHLFGTVVNGVVQVSEIRAIAHQDWLDIPKHFSRAVCAWVMMPNHVLGILFLTIDPSVTRPANAGERLASLPQSALRGPQLHDIGAIVGSFKLAVTRRINALNPTPGITVW